QEWRVYFASHPFALLFAEVLGRLGAVVPVPGFGYVVNEPELARAILQRPESFTKNGPGGSGALLSQVLGEYAILNMEAEAHRALRARLTDLFAPAYLERVLPELMAAPLTELRDALEAGETVDLVRFAKALSGRITCRMLDIEVEPETEEQT